MIAATRRDLGVVGAALLSLMLLYALPAAANDWLLMSREGECNEIAPALRHRFGEFAPVRTPEEFVEALRARGIAARATPVDGAVGVVMVEAPRENLTLIFAQRSRCGAIGKPRR